MDAKELQVWKRVAKMLTSFRTTLDPDEQRVLDQLISRSTSEVEMHAIEPQAQGRLDSSLEPKIAETESEVALHQLTPEGRTSPPILPKAALRIRLDSNDEYIIEQVKP